MCDKTAYRKDCADKGKPSALENTIDYASRQGMPLEEVGKERRVRKFSDPCLSCHYRDQACGYIMDGHKAEDACLEKRIWLSGERRKNANIKSDGSIIGDCVR